MQNEYIKDGVPRFAGGVRGRIGNAYGKEGDPVQGTYQLYRIKGRRQTKKRPQTQAKSNIHANSWTEAEHMKVASAMWRTLEPDLVADYKRRAIENGTSAFAEFFREFRSGI